MEVKVFLLLMVFIALFFIGGILFVLGLLKKNRKQWTWGIVILILCCVFTWAIRFL